LALATETELRKTSDQKHGTRQTEKAKGPKTRDEKKNKKNGREKTHAAKRNKLNKSINYY
jgi:hypothetical protein